MCEQETKGNLEKNKGRILEELGKATDDTGEQTNCNCEQTQSIDQREEIFERYDDEKTKAMSKRQGRM